MAVSPAPSGIGARIREREKRRQAAVAAAIVEAAHVGARFIQSKMPRDMGELRRSVQVHIAPPGSTEVARIDVEAPHAAFIEHGTRPHMPPLQPLVLWVLRHADKLGLEGDVEKAAERVARAIQWKIYQHGSPPQWIVRGSLPTLREIARRLIAARRPV